MGSSGSKVAQSGARKFPTRAPGTAAPPPVPRSARPPPEPRSRPAASSTENASVRADARNPEASEDMNQAFADRLRQMGIVQPNPTYSPSSTASPFPDPDRPAQSMPLGPSFPSAQNNVTLGVLEARRKWQELADAEFANTGKSGDKGREFLDIRTLRDILFLREQGHSAADIESRLRLKPGVVARLGPPGILTALASPQP